MTREYSYIISGFDDILEETLIASSIYESLDGRKSPKKFIMLQKAFLFSSGLLLTARAQQVGTYTAETHPSLTWQTCTSVDDCTTIDGTVVIDANWRWVHDINSTTNCYTGNTWDATLCQDDATCAINCAVEGADYESTYGVTTSGSSLTINFVTENSNGANVGARLFLLEDSTTL